ncbi:MAG: hypothetical protein WCV00_17795 [Verrucomicrobiia bacterium]|jgi:hypothetical protein
MAMMTIQAPPVAEDGLQPARHLPPAHPWEEFAALVREFQPDVVVLVARKMPRLVELFHLDFGRSALVISDLAVPFAHAYFRNAKVAVIDDTVNVGSTLEHVAGCVRACGAREVELFSLGRRTGTPESLKVRCVYPDPLTDEQYDRLVGSVPEAISVLAKPYDLVFPSIPCRLNVPYRSAGQVVAWLRETQGHARVHYLTPQFGHAGLARVTVDLRGDGCGNYKLRLYFDERSGICNVVPFAIPPHLSDGAFTITSPSARRLFRRLEGALRDAPQGASLWEGEALCQARLFAASLEQGLRLLDDLDDVLTLRGCGEFDQTDAAMLFGPAAAADDFIVCKEQEPAPIKVECPVSGESPFLQRFCRPDILARIHAQADGDDHLSLFKALFDVLAELVGASNPKAYSFGWPYSPEEIQKKPYLRLRIGPAFDDLVAIMANLVSAKGNNARVLPLRNLVSALLDYGIDCGAVVPALTNYNGSFHRVYRKGEAGLHEKAENRMLFAWSSSGRWLSLTNFTKINAILAFCEDYEPVLSPRALQRGNVASLQATVLDLDEPEVSHYLRDTGKLSRREATTPGSR